MRTLILSLALATAFVVAGCKSTVCDGRGPSEMCELHHEIMQTEVVDNPHRKEAPSQEYMEARVQGFIHSYPFALPDQCDKCAVWICDACVHAEKEWKHAHPGVK